MCTFISRLSADMSTEATYSTHDPKKLMFILVNTDSWVRGLHRVLDRTRSRCEQNKHGGSRRSHDCHVKRCVKNSLTHYSFPVIQSRVFSNCTVIFIGLLRLKKRSTEKEKHRGKDCQKAADPYRNLRDFTEANWRKSNAKPIYHWRAPPFVEP